MHKVYLSFIASLFLLNSAASGQVIIDEPEEIISLQEKILSENREKDTDAGWRIQILATTERRNMDKETVLFEKRFPDLERTEKYKKPYYRILTGAQKERMGLYPLLQRVQKYYPSAFIIKDPEIPKEEFFSY
ncbi:MAG TPA: hypothetical protein VJ917_02595 [Saprospiraceae bacterium]|nr:hypothetical protein [Saprospiraceae bacterium]